MINNNDTTFKYAFITGYSQIHRWINQIMTKHWHIFKKDPHLEKVISDRPCIIYRRARTLKNVLVPSYLRKHNKDSKQNSINNLQKKGSFKCRHEKCTLSVVEISLMSYIQSTVNKKVFHIKTFLNCGSANVCQGHICTMYLRVTVYG